MTNEADNPERLEREIEQDRDALRRTLNDLQEELSLDGFTRRLTEKFRENGSDWANAASEAARSNPVALALTGVGLAWMIFGRGYDPVHNAMDHRSDRRSSDWDRPSKPYTVSTSRSDMSRSDSSSMGGSPSNVTGQGGWNSSQTGSQHRSGLSSGSRSGGGSYSGSRSGSGGSHAGGSRQGGMSETLRQKAQSWRDRVGSSTSSLHDRLSEGTEGFSEEARRRVHDARRRALEAQETASRRLRERSRMVSKGYDSEPLFFGVAAAAIGAGLACLLPRTRQEDELLGSYSDQLFHEAESIYEEEKAKVQRAVAAGLDEAKSAAGQVTAAAQKELHDDHGQGRDGESGQGSRSDMGSGSGSAGQSGRPGSAS